MKATKFLRGSVALRARALGIFAVAVLAGGCLRADTAAVQRPTTAAEFEQQMEALRARLNIPGMSAAVARDGAIIWAAGLGYADRERGVRADTNSVYQLASLTKPYAATVVLQLVEQGLLDLDTPIHEFGVETDGADTVRLWHVLSHTASSAPPGTGYRYDAHLYGELGTVIASVTGRPFAVELAERVIRPLDLRHTGPNPHDARGALTRSGLDASAIEDNLVTGYARAWGRRLWPTGLFGPMRTMAHPTSFHTSAGLVASAPDVARFSMALYDGRLLSSELQARAWSPVVTPAGDTLAHGLGWFVQEHEGVRLVWYYGHWFGSSALIVKVPGRRLTFVVLANSDGLSRWRSLGDHADVLRSPAARLFLDTFVTGDLAKAGPASSTGTSFFAPPARRFDLARDFSSFQPSSHGGSQTYGAPR
jgi:CubicO group peptidase (beta-lactamase class C family)